MTKTNQKIPERWSVTRLELLGEFSKGSGITKNDLMQNGLPCVRYAELYTKFDFIIPCCISFISEETAKTAKPIRIGDILFAGSGETKEEIGKCAVYMNGINAYAGGDNIIFRTIQAEPLYLSFYLNTLGRKQLNKLGQGDSIVHIHSNDLKNVIVPLPPLSEQKKIAEILGTWDSAIEKLSKLIEQKKLLKKGLMQRLLSGKQRLSGFSEPWKNVKLGECLSLLKDGTHGTHQNLPDGIMLLSAKDVINGNILLPSDSRRISQEDFNTLHKNYHLQNDDVVLTIVGTIGRCAIIKNYSNNYTFQRSVAILRPNKNIISKFLYILLQGKKFQNALFNRQSISAQPGVYLHDLSKITFNLPPLFEQKAIADILSKADEEIDLLTSKLSALKSQKKGLMQKLLTGQIRVKVA